MRPDGRDERSRPEQRPDDSPGDADWTLEPTPSPSSWRTAAWLAVAVTSVALIVLVFAAVRLAGPDGRIGRIESFPGLPTGGLLTPQQPSAGVPAASPTAGATGHQRTTVTAQSRPEQGGPATVPGSQVRTRPGDPQPTGGGGGGQQPTTDPAQPTGTTASPSVTEAQADVVASTYEFFGFLPGDLESAWNMMSPRVQLQGFEEFRLYWNQYSDVELQYVTVGADGTTVVATVNVTEHKGETSSQRWKLIYQLGETVVIDEATLLERGPLDPGGNKPFK